MVLIKRAEHFTIFFIVIIQCGWECIALHRKRHFSQCVCNVAVVGLCGLGGLGGKDKRRTRSIQSLVAVVVVVAEAVATAASIRATVQLRMANHVSSTIFIAATTFAFAGRVGQR
jgi:hypothetical protein